MPKISAACGTDIIIGTSSKFLYIFITYFLKKRGGIYLPPLTVHV